MLLAFKRNSFGSLIILILFLNFFRFLNAISSPFNPFIMKLLVTFVFAFFLFHSAVTAQVTNPNSMILVPPTLEEQKKLRSQLYDFEHDTRTTFKNIMLAESAWSLGNILFSTLAKDQNSLTGNNFHNANVGINIYNLAYCGANYLIFNSAPLKVKTYLDRSERFHKIFAIKAAVDGVFLLGSFISLKNSQPSYYYQNGIQTAYAEQNGGTYGVMMNAVIYLGFDIAGFILEGKHIEKFRPIVRSNQLGFILDLN